MRIKAIIFDKDGTLFDIQRSWSQWCNIFIDKFCKAHNLKTEFLAHALNFDLESGLFKKESIFVHGSIDEVIDKLEEEQTENKFYMFIFHSIELTCQIASICSTIPLMTPRPWMICESVNVSSNLIFLFV